MSGLAHAHKEVEKRAGLSVRVHRVSMLSIKSKANMVFEQNFKSKTLNDWIL